jgi:release factor glutamine methyltransferase
MSQSDAPWTVERVLSWTRGYFERKQLESARLCAELIIAHVLNVPRIKLYTDYQQVLTDAELTRLRDLVKRAGEEEPIGYLTGRAHFFNLELEIRPGVLIPRPDTETLVEQVMSLIKHTPGFEAPRILDLCTGSGAVALAIAHHVKSAMVVATDIHDHAIAVARANIDKHNLADRVTLLQGDLFAALGAYVDKTPFDILTANPPYIATGQMSALPRHVRDYEPHLALDGGPDGLDPHRRILTGAADRVRAGGRVLLEIAFDQQEAAIDMAGQFPAFADPKILRDHAGHPRVLALTRSNP